MHIDQKLCANYCFFYFVGFSDYILTSIAKETILLRIQKENLVVDGWKNEWCIKFHEAGINNQSMNLTSWWVLWALWTLRVAIFWISSGIFHNMFFACRQVCPPHFSCCFVCIWLKIRYSLISNNENSYIGKSLFKNIFSSQTWHCKKLIYNKFSPISYSHSNINKNL